MEMEAQKLSKAQLKNFGCEFDVKHKVLLHAPPSRRLLLPFELPSLQGLQSCKWKKN